MTSSLCSANFAGIYVRWLRRLLVAPDRRGARHRATYRG